MYKKTKLANGLRIITQRMPQAKSAALGIWIKTGGRQESLEHKGIAHFLEHLIFKGSRRYSCRRIKESIEGSGGSLNGFTSEEITCYWAKVPHLRLGLALDILSDIVAHPLLQEQEVQKERTVILEEIKMYRDLPQSYVYELLDALLWPGQALGESILGSVESVSRIGKKELSCFQKRHYVLSNLVVSAAGVLEHDWCVAKIKGLFPGIKAGSQDVLLPAQEPEGKPAMKLLSKDTEQTHLVLGFHSFKRDHPLRHALGLLHVLLGANMSSRLFNEIREKRGLAYEIGTQVKRFQDTGAFMVHAGIDNQKAPQVVTLILQELRKIRERTVGRTEFSRAKEFYLGQLMLALEDTLDHMLWIGESTTALDKTYSWADIVRQVNRIGSEDVRKAARMIFQTAKINLALIGPSGSSEKEIYKRLHIE